MTVKMSSEGDSSKNLSLESNEKSETENTDSSQDVKDAKPDAPAENSVEKKVEDSKPKEASKESSDEPDKKADGGKAAPEKAENAKSEVATSDKKEDKAKAKKVEEEENSEEEEEEDEDDEKSEKSGDKDKEVPLLDQPLEKSGKRERKNVQRFKEDVPEPKEIEIPSGSGTSLGNIPRVDASISRFKNDDMKLFHKVLFRTPGKNTMIKKNIKKFSGFDFKKDSDEYTRKVAFMHKCELKQLKSICEMLDLQKNGNKDDIIERILEFLLEPKDSGKAVGGGRPKRTAAVRANNRGYSSHDNYSSDERHSGARSARDKGRRSNLKDDSSSASDEDFEPSDDGSEEKPRVTKRKRVERKKVESEDDVSEVESASSEDSDFQEEPKSKRKKNVKANNKSKGKSPGKRGRPAGKKTAKAGKKKKESSEEEEEEEEEESEQKEEGASSSSEDEPLVKKATKTAQPPTDEEIKSYIKEILEGANLEQITMKTVCQQVYAHYPDFDLTHKKDFIKSTVKSLIST